MRPLAQRKIIGLPEVRRNGFSEPFVRPLFPTEHIVYLSTGNCTGKASRHDDFRIARRASPSPLQLRSVSSNECLFIRAACSFLPFRAFQRPLNMVYGVRVNEGLDRTSEIDGAPSINISRVSDRSSLSPCASSARRGGVEFLFPVISTKDIGRGGYSLGRMNRRFIGSLQITEFTFHLVLRAPRFVVIAIRQLYYFIVKLANLAESL